MPDSSKGDSKQDFISEFGSEVVNWLLGSKFDLAVGNSELSSESPSVLIFVSPARLCFGALPHLLVWGPLSPLDSAQRWIACSQRCHDCRRSWSRPSSIDPRRICKMRQQWCILKEAFGSKLLNVCRIWLGDLQQWRSIWWTLLQNMLADACLRLFVFAMPVICTCRFLVSLLEYLLIFENAPSQPFRLAWLPA